MYWSVRTHAPHVMHGASQIVGIVSLSILHRLSLACMREHCPHGFTFPNSRRLTERPGGATLAQFFENPTSGARGSFSHRR